MISFKIAIVVLLSQVISGEDFNLDFVEEGSNYTELIKIDNSSVIYEVPKHAQLEKAVHFYDYDAKLIAIKNYGARKCYVYDMPNNSHNPQEIKNGMKKIDRKSPNNFVLERSYIVPSTQANIGKIPRKIRDFCGSFPVLKVDFFQRQQDADKDMFKLLNSANTKRVRRQTGGHFGCTKQDIYDLKSCKAQGKEPTGKTCKWATSSCVMFMACTQTGPFQFRCDPPTHATQNIAICCKYTCDL